MDRAHIAALALSGILGSTDEDGRPLATPELAAREAVAYADALLAELRSDYHESPSSPGELVAGEDEGAPSIAAAMPRSTDDGAKDARPARAREQDGEVGALRLAGSADPGAQATGAPAAAKEMVDAV